MVRSAWVVMARKTAMLAAAANNDPVAASTRGLLSRRNRGRSLLALCPCHSRSSCSQRVWQRSHVSRWARQISACAVARRPSTNAARSSGVRHASGLAGGCSPVKASKASRLSCALFFPSSLVSAIAFLWVDDLDILMDGLHLQLCRRAVIRAGAIPCPIRL